MRRLLPALRGDTRRFWKVLLLAAIAVHLILLLDDFILPWGWRVSLVWDKPRLIRSADMSLGASARRAIEFVNSVVPDEATIVLPPPGEPGRFSLERSMQYFFFPRELLECEAPEQEACKAALQDDGAYILATADFPPSEYRQGRAFAASPHDKGWWFQGLYGPGFLADVEPAGMTIPGYLRLILQDGLILIALFLLGVFVLLRFKRAWNLPDLLSLAFPLGAGLVAMGMFLTSWAGVRLSAASVLVFYLLLLVPLLVTSVPDLKAFKDSLSREGTSERREWSKFSIGLVVFAVVWFGLAVALSAGLSYRLTDPVQIWSVKGYGISEAGSIMGAQRWGVHDLAYPLNIPLQISIFHLFDGDALPGSKLLYPLYALSLAAVLYRFLREWRIDRELSLLGVLLLATTPIYFFHAVSGFSNLPYTFYLISGVLWGIRGFRSRENSALAIGGMLLGLAAWTRPEGIGFGVGVALLLVLVGRRRMVTRTAGTSLVLPLALLTVPWFLFTLSGSTMQGSNLEEAVSVYSVELFQGNLDLSELWILLRVFITSIFIPSIPATTWGLFFPVLILMFLAFLWGRKRGSAWDSTMLAIQMVFIGLVTVGMFYIRSFSKGGFASFIERSFPRAFLPTASLLFLHALIATRSQISGDTGPDTLDAAEGR